MFTGIVEGTGEVVSMVAGRLDIDLGELAEGVEIGDSVSINGVCLTAAGLDEANVGFDVMPETLKKTDLGKLKVGGLVNIERSLKMGERNDGHFVQGHVQGTGEVVERISENKDYMLWIKPTEKLMQFIALQGSIAVAGVSLTVAQLREDSFAVALIPTTLKLTNLGNLREGDVVNVETDMMARQIVHFLELRGNV